jgi:hypothetical protein
MEGTSPDSQQPDEPTPSASLQEEQTSTGETDEAFDECSFPVCEECETLFTRPEGAEFRERLARLPTQGIWQRERAEMLKEEDVRRSILEDSFITFGEWAEEHLKHPEKYKDLPPRPPPEPEIELRFSRSRISMARAAVNGCTLCQVLLALSKKEGYFLLEPPRHEAEDLGEDELRRRDSNFINAELEAAEVSASVASSTLLFRIHTQADSGWLFLSHENFDSAEFTKMPCIRIEMRAPIG